MSLANRDTSKRMVGNTLVYKGLVKLRALDHHQTKRWQICRPDEQNDIGQTSIATQNCQQNANDGPTNNCYLGTAVYIASAQSFILAINPKLTLIQLIIDYQEY